MTSLSISFNRSCRSCRRSRRSSRSATVRRRRRASFSSPASTRTSSRPRRRTTPFPISTRMCRRRLSTRQARPACRKASTSAIVSLCCTQWPSSPCSDSRRSMGGFDRDDVYMPITPMFHVHAWGFPWAATLAGVKQVYPGRYDPALLVKLIKTERRHLHPWRADDPANAARRRDEGGCRSCRAQDGDRRVGAAKGACEASHGARGRRLRRLRHVGNRASVDGGPS